jgi:O-antigen ligase
VIRALAGAALLLPLSSALGSPALPLALRFLLVALWLTMTLRPHAGLIALTIAAPFGAWVLNVVHAAPVRYTEALVLAALSGALIASTRRRLTPLRPQPPRLVPAALLFGFTIACSAAVVLAVSQIGARTAWPFLRAFPVFLMRDYLVGLPGAEYAGVADAALLLEGVALLLVVARHARDGVVRPPQLMQATAAAALGAAALTIGRLLIAAGSADSLRELVTRLAASRITVHVADVNAAGSYFAMGALVAVGLAVDPFHRRRRAWWGSAAAVLFTALWITGSRMALLGAIGAGVLVWIRLTSLLPKHWPRWSIAVLAGGAALLLAAVALGLDPRPSGARSAGAMVNMRAAFMLTGLRMIASAPLFGVGIGRYLEMSGQFMPQSIYWFYYHENAHNNFLQIAGELGLVGLAGFLWLLGAAMLRLWRGLAASPDDRLHIGVLAAALAFIATWLTSHPLLVAEVAYPFWILLGAAVARADGDVQPPLAGPVPDVLCDTNRSSRFGLIAAVVASVPLVASVPVRARQQASAVNLTQQTYGFYPWEQDRGQKYRWTSRRAAFFVPAGTRELALPIRTLHVGANTQPTKVTIAIGGRTLHTMQAATDDWTTVHLLLPRDGRPDGFRRIEIISEPAWSPAALFRDRLDMRILGVQVGEVVAK